MVLEFNPRQFVSGGLAVNHHAPLPLSIILNTQKSLLPQIKLPFEWDPTAVARWENGRNLANAAQLKMNPKLGDELNLSIASS